MLFESIRRIIFAVVVVGKRNSSLKDYMIECAVR
jgi:hypothetical protein